VFTTKDNGEIVLFDLRFQPVNEREITLPVQVKAETAPPEPIVEEVSEQEIPTIWREDEEEERGLDLQTLPGVTNTLARELEKRGWTDADAILAQGTEGLETVSGIGPTKARLIIEHLNR